jgi:antitoxin (DNA-binding transcriptional repressor) of toxin-antitoxin stability system
MKTLSSREVQKNFGSVADLVSSGESVRVTKYGRPAFLIIPETSDSDEILRRLAGNRLSKMLQESQPTEAAKSLSQDDVNALVSECFA